MTTPVAPWSEFARSEWARIGERWDADPLRALGTDDEPGMDAGVDFLDAAILATLGWLVALGVVGAALAAVLVALGIGKAAGR